MARATFLLPDFDQTLNVEFGPDEIIMSFGTNLLTTFRNFVGFTALDSILNSRGFLIFIASIFSSFFINQGPSRQLEISDMGQMSIGPQFDVQNELQNEVGQNLIQLDVNAGKMVFNSSLLFKNLTRLRNISLDSQISRFVQVFASQNVRVVQLFESQLTSQLPDIDSTALQACLTNILLFFMCRQLYRKVGALARKKIGRLLPKSPFKLFFQIGTQKQVPKQIETNFQEFDTFQALQLPLFDQFKTNGNIDAQRLDAILEKFEQKLEQPGLDIDGIFQAENSLSRMPLLELRARFNQPMTVSELTNSLVGFEADEMLERFFICKIWKQAKQIDIEVFQTTSGAQVLQNIAQPFVEAVSTNLINITQKELAEKLNVSDTNIQTIQSDATIITIPQQTAVQPTSFLQSIQRFGTSILSSVYNSIPSLTGFIFPILFSWTLPFITSEWLNSFLYSFGIAKTSLDLLAGNPTILWQALTSYFIAPRLFQFTWLFDFKGFKSYKNVYQNVSRNVSFSIQSIKQSVNAAAAIGVAFQTFRVGDALKNVSAQMFELLFSNIKIDFNDDSLVSQIFVFCQKLSKIIVGNAKTALAFAVILFTLLTTTLGMTLFGFASTCVAVIGQYTFDALVSVGSVFNTLFGYTTSLISGIVRQENVGALQQIIVSTPQPPPVQAPLEEFLQTLSQMDPSGPSPVFALGKAIFESSNAAFAQLKTFSFSDYSYLIALILALVMMALSSRSIASETLQPTDDIDRSLCLYDWLDLLQEQISFQSDWCELLVLTGREKINSQSKLRKNLPQLIEKITINPSCFVSTTNRTLNRLRNARNSGFEVQTIQWQNDLILDRQEIQQIINRERDSATRNQLLDDFNNAYSSLTSMLQQQLEIYSFLNQS